MVARSRSCRNRHPAAAGIRCPGVDESCDDRQLDEVGVPVYTDTWTPRHRYGFDNANIDPSLPESKVLQAYDNWAENLTIRKSRIERRTANALQPAVDAGYRGIDVLHHRGTAFVF